MTALSMSFDRLRPPGSSLEPWAAERVGEAMTGNSDQPLYPKPIGRTFPPPTLRRDRVLEQFSRYILLGRAVQDRISSA